LTGHQVGDRADHAPELRAVLLDDRVADATQPQRTQGLAVHLLATDLRLDLGHLELSHQAPASARAFSIAAGATSSSGRPRRAATASGCSRSFSARTAACTTLIELSEPSELLSTS